MSTHVPSPNCQFPGRVRKKLTASLLLHWPTVILTLVFESAPRMRLEHPRLHPRNLADTFPHVHPSELCRFLDDANSLCALLPSASVPLSPASWFDFSHQIQDTPHRLLSRFLQRHTGSKFSIRGCLDTGKKTDKEVGRLEPEATAATRQCMAAMEMVENERETWITHLWTTNTQSKLITRSHSTLTTSNLHLQVSHSQALSSS